MMHYAVANSLYVASLTALSLHFVGLGNNARGGMKFSESNGRKSLEER
jgi:hypothetical protein